MSKLDEQLRERLRGAQRPVAIEDVVSRTLSRSRRAGRRRRIGSAALVISVLGLTAAGFVGLQSLFDGAPVAVDTSPTIVPSPRTNGPLVVVVPDGDQTSHLELDRLDGSLPEQLTEPGQELAVDPAASPDGRRVAFISIPGQGRPAPLVVVDVETGERQVIADDAFGDPSWSPDGRSIAYEGLLDDETGIVTIDLATGERTYLTAGADPSWSPDGSTIAFELPSDRPPVRVEQQGIFTVPATGGEATRILESGTSPSWSPDGSSLAITRPIGVWVASADGSDERLIVGWTPEDAQTIFTDISYADPSWSPDGTAVVYTTYTAREEWIESIPADRTSPYQVTNRGGDAPWRMSEGSTDAAWLPLTDAAPTETPTATSGPDAAEQLAGVPFLVCRITTVSGTFGGGMDTAWVFEEERVPGAGCVGEGFQHLAVGSGGSVDLLSPRITDVLNDDAWRVWAYAAPDVNGDGIDEIAIARQGSQPRARHLWLFTVADGRLRTVADIGLEPVDCGPDCDPVAWNVEIGPIAHENGAVSDSGLFCGLPGGRPEDRDALIYWQADTDDLLHVYLSKWHFDGRMLVPADGGELLIQGVPGAFPPSGLESLCGSSVSTSPIYLMST